MAKMVAKMIRFITETLPPWPLASGRYCLRQQLQSLENEMLGFRNGFCWRREELAVFMIFDVFLCFLMVLFLLQHEKARAEKTEKGNTKLLLGKARHGQVV